MSQDQKIEPIITFEGVSKWYGHHHVLKNINFSVKSGEQVVICGPSGSGKSTMIRCVNRLEAYQKGRLMVDGNQILATDARPEGSEGSIGMVFQHFNLFPHMSVLDNCTLALKLVRRMKEADAAEIAMGFLTKVRIADQAHKHPGQLSGGQQQRVAIARSLCMKPRIMLFDEPTSALDPETIQEVLDVMRDLAESNMTMLCVTHEMNFARSVADRVIFMADGKIVEQAPPNEFFQNPKTQRAQTFLSQLLH